MTYSNFKVADLLDFKSKYCISILDANNEREKSPPDSMYIRRPLMEDSAISALVDVFMKISNWKNYRELESSDMQDRVDCYLKQVM